MVEQNSALAGIVPELAAFGQSVTATDLGSKVNGAMRVDGVWVGASDPRSEGTALMLDRKGRIVGREGASLQDAPTATVY